MTERFMDADVKMPGLCPQSLEPGKIAMDDIIGNLFHDAQNSVHLVGMELELVSMGLGDSSDILKTVEIVKQLENNLRDLRGYISAIQEPAATCDPAAVLDGVLATLQLRNPNRQCKLTSVIPQSMPTVPTHAKLLSRILERVFDFCENLLPQGGEVGIVAASQHIGGQIYVDLNLTLLSTVAIPMIAEEELAGNRSDRRRTNLGIERALEVLRRHGGQTAFRRNGDYECQLTLRMLASPR
ncbi:MAG: hypothetical protein ACREQV_05170 [Candidatus Binatia bacterium]